MIAKFLQDVDRFERLRTGSAKEFLNLGRGDKETVEVGLELAKTTEDDMLVFDGD